MRNNTKNTFEKRAWLSNPDEIKVVEQIFFTTVAVFSCCLICIGMGIAVLIMALI